jgi:hypothetical protein
LSAPSPSGIDKINHNDDAPPNPNLRNDHLPMPPKFLKPAGIDDPSPSDHVARRDAKRPTQRREDDIIKDGTQRRQNLKRERNDRRGTSSGDGDGGGGGGALTSDRDRKRKKSGAAAAAAAAA